MTQVGYSYDASRDYRARYYDPTIGRFISEDPTKFGGGINFYSYAYNRPMNFSDPDGLKPRPLDPSAKIVVQAWIDYLAECKKSPVAQAAAQGLQVLLDNNDILTDDDFAERINGFTTPSFFEPKIILGPWGYNPDTLVHEWVHTTQMKWNPLRGPLTIANAIQGVLNGTSEGFLDHSAERIAQKVCKECHE